MRKKKKDVLFHQYFEELLELYKVGAIREIKLDKYYVTHQKIIELAPSSRLSDLDRRNYQLELQKGT